MKEKIKKTISCTELKKITVYNTPQKIQDYINSIPMRDDSNEPIVRSPQNAVLENEISCIEGALLACVMLAHHGYETYLLDLKIDKSNNVDCDHVVTLFKKNNHWGAISKTSHAVLRYREPIYKSVRELAMSYFHEYFLDDGQKTLRSFSEKFPVFKKFGFDWIVSENDIYEIACELDNFKHQKILTPKMIRDLRKADTIEIQAGKTKE